MTDLDHDVRLLRRNLAKGFVSQAEVQKILDELPDVADQAEWIDIELGDDEETEDDG